VRKKRVRSRKFLGNDVKTEEQYAELHRSS
jgi:hypothetical protein